MKCCWK